MKNLTIYIFLAIAFISCKKDIESHYDVGYNYYPIEVGNTWIYDADSIVYDDFLQDTISFAFQIKEYIDSSFTDDMGETAYKLLKYKRIKPTDPWILKKTWVIKKTNIQVERVEENTRYVPIIFPVKESSKWNVNAYNDSTEQEYKYTNVNKSYKLGSNTIDSTVVILQKENNDLTKKISASEVYAKQLGMIYKELVNINLQRKSGFEYYLTLQSFEKSK